MANPAEVEVVEEEVKEVVETPEVDEVEVEEEVKVVTPKVGDIEYTKGVEKRIGKLTRKKHEAEREADRLREENAYLKGQADGSRVQGNVVQADSNEPQEVDFETHELYTKALVKHEIDKRDRDAKAKADSESSASHRESIHNSFVKRIESSNIRETIPDFDEVVNNGVGYSGHPNLEEIVLTSDPNIAYYLEDNLEVMDKFKKMNTIQASREIERLEVKLTSSPNTKNITNATPPINPLNGDDVVTKNPEDMTQAEYNAWRKKGGGR